MHTVRSHALKRSFFNLSSAGNTRFVFQVTDIDQMCLLVDALRPDESREVFTRRGFLNVTNPIFADRYYQLDLSVWDDREMAKILIRLVGLFFKGCQC